MMRYILHFACCACRLLHTRCFDDQQNDEDTVTVTVAADHNAGKPEQARVSTVRISCVHNIVFKLR